MSAATPAPLTRADIDKVVDGLTMGDVQAAFESGDIPEKAMGGIVFRRAAKRLGVVANGTDPLDLVSAGDVRYLGTKLQAAMADTNPESESSAD